jgi:uncharacterized integral membrane protein
MEKGEHMKPQTIVSLVIGALILILILQNTHDVVVRIFFWKPELPLVLLIAIVLIVGFIAGVLVKNIAGASSRKKDEY